MQNKYALTLLAQLICLTCALAESAIVSFRVESRVDPR